MEKLLEQEALLEQQDPKVRLLGASRSRAESQTCPGSSALPFRARTLDKWIFTHSLLRSAKPETRPRACLRSVSKLAEIGDLELSWADGPEAPPDGWPWCREGRVRAPLVLAWLGAGQHSMDGNIRKSGRSVFIWSLCTKV